MSNGFGFRHGYLCEKYFDELIRQYIWQTTASMDSVRDNLYWANGNQEDQDDGTDFLVRNLEILTVNNIRIDVTENPEKDHVDWIKGFVSPQHNTKVRFGVRKENNSGKVFEYPVAVILFEAIDASKRMSYWELKDTKTAEFFLKSAEITLRKWSARKEAKAKA